MSAINPNVIVIVLDTLREDYSQDLDHLVNSGFKKYHDVIAPSSWTLPSHASMFTGLMPSAHGVHVSRDSYVWGGMMKLSRQQLTKHNDGLVERLKASGYTTYGVTSNGFVTPKFGFLFENYWLCDQAGLISRSQRNCPKQIKTIADPVENTLLRRYLKTYESPIQKYVKRTRSFVRSRVKSNFYRFLNPLEKGSRYFAKILESFSFREPFFLFVNIMEAHQPYFRNDPTNWVIAEVTYKKIIGREYERDLQYRKAYPKAANLSISRLRETLAILGPFLDESVVVVTSDHGQFLGERGMFDHGFFLDDELLKVPLFVRYPKDEEPPRQNEKFVSLCSIPSIIEGALKRVDSKVGSRYALAESFGPITNIDRFAKDDTERKMLEHAYSHRIRVYTEKGKAIYNKTTNTFEEKDGMISEEEVKEITKRLCLGEFKHELSIEEPAAIKNERPFDSTEEAEIIERLKNLGYS